MTAEAPSERHLDFVLLVVGACLVVLGAVVGRAGFWYGQAWLEWDPAGATNFYAERPGGFLVLLVTQAWMMVVFIAALGLVTIVSARWFRRSAKHHQHNQDG